MTNVLFKKSDNYELWTSALAGQLLRIVAANPEQAYTSEIAKRVHERYTGPAFHKGAIREALLMLEEHKLVASDFVKMRGQPQKVRLFRLTTQGAFMLSLASGWDSIAFAP